MRPALAILFALGLVAAFVMAPRRGPISPPAFLTRPQVDLMPRPKPPTFETIRLPGPHGQPIMASFYALERLPPSDDDLCALLRPDGESGRRIAQQAIAGAARHRPGEGPGTQDYDDSLKESFAALWNRGCAAGKDDEDIDIPQAKRGGHLLQLAMLLSSLGGPSPDGEMIAATTIRWVIKRLKTARSADEASSILRDGCSIGAIGESTPLFMRRFTADCDRTRAHYCEPGPGQDPCKVRLLVDVGNAYARLGRLQSDEQHFRDMAAALDEAEPLVRALADRSRRTDLLDDIASSFGYAGESGRDVRLLRRALDIAQTNLAETDEGQPGDTPNERAGALELVGVALSRLATSEPDRVGATLRAIEAHERAIAYRAQHTPEAPSWDTHINLAADQRDLFDMTKEAALVDGALTNARSALALLAERGSLEERDDDKAHYVKARLGQILATRAKFREGLPDGEREAQVAEAKSLLDNAERVFRRMNAQAYLRIITRARSLLPAEDAQRDR